MTTSSATDRGAALAILLQGREIQAAERITTAFNEHQLNLEELVAQGFCPDALCDHLGHKGFNIQTLFNAVYNGYLVSSFNEHKATAVGMLAYMEELSGYTE